jgi:hypothetical protein
VLAESLDTRPGKSMVVTETKCVTTGAMEKYCEEIQLFNKLNEGVDKCPL